MARLLGMCPNLEREYREGLVVAGLLVGAADPGTPVGTLMADPEAGADLKATLDNLHRGSALLNEDITALQDNFLLRRYFRKQTKAKAKAAAAEQPASPTP